MLTHIQSPTSSTNTTAVPTDPHTSPAKRKLPEDPPVLRHGTGTTELHYPLVRRTSDGQILQVGPKRLKLLEKRLGAEQTDDDEAFTVSAERDTSELTLGSGPCLILKLVPVQAKQPCSTSPSQNASRAAEEASARKKEMSLFLPPMTVSQETPEKVVEATATPTGTFDQLSTFFPHPPLSPARPDPERWEATETPIEQPAQPDPPSGGKKKKKSPHFTEGEDTMILQGHERFGDNWEEIVEWGQFDRSVRTAASIKGRFSRLQNVRRKGGPSTIDSTENLAPPKAQVLSNHSTDSFEGNPAAGETPARRLAMLGRTDGSSPYVLWPTGGALLDPALETSLLSAQSSPGGRASTRKIHEYFPRAAGQSLRGDRVADAMHAEDEAHQPSILSTAGSAPEQARCSQTELQRWRSQLEQEVAALRQGLEIAESMQQKLQAEKEGVQLELTALEQHLDVCRDTAKQNIARIEERAEAQLAQARALIVDTLREKAQRAAEEVRLRVSADAPRLGSMKYDRHGISFVERWDNGNALEKLEESVDLLTREREEIERERKVLAKRLKQTKEAVSSKADQLASSRQHTQPNAAGSASAPGLERVSPAEFHELEVIAKLRLAQIKTEEADIRTQIEKLHTQRTLHIRQSRRIYDEDQSRFAQNPLLNNRYLLTSLIGKGGFSEVHRAFDTHSLQHVACKIHSLSDHWPEARKQSYIKHSLREYRIHKQLAHQRVVRLFDVFEYDHLSFVTVMEHYGEGLDLESHLMVVKQIPEKEARSIITQVLSALKYLNELDNPIIHYDLKPGNILIHKGKIKITDFGLSKIVEQADPGSHMGAGLRMGRDIELTSQGAGTYFYLPPEVFSTARNKEPVTISSKVDVWSLGCVFYELLFGAKPFGNDQSQQTILREGTITRDAMRLEFPVKPVVSAETRALIAKCLEYRQDRRPDVLTLANDPYFNPK
ncbi:hypothetical protein HKX48_005056 [Thoreauomyces humboldtii]|nr:hypothetical protein HKX48_005056 [Thoreauomyces humboldtii]